MPDQGNGFLVVVYPYLSASLWQIWNTPHGRAGLTEASLSIQYVAHAAKGLAHIHELGIIHDDVVMENMMMEGGTVKVANMHSAVSTIVALNQGRNPRTSSAKPYTAMPPEKALGCNTYTISVDSWGLGVIALAFLTGHFPTLDVDSLGALFDAMLRILGPITLDEKND